jgi:hypothetical protein
MPESQDQRQNRQLQELLNELRLALPGTQVLFAFLLTLGFTQRFTELGDLDRTVYFGSLSCAAISITLFIAPSAHHRMRFQRHARGEIIRAANKYLLAGLVFLALAMSGVLFLVADLLFRTWIAALVGAGLGLGMLLFWFVVPRIYEARNPGPPAALTDVDIPPAE